MHRHDRWSRRRLVSLVQAMAVLVIPLAACQKPQPGASAIRESADRGKQQIIAYGCGSCHVIPGIAQANGLVGPPLTHFAKRAYIAGEVANNPEFLTQWIAVPQSIEPGTVMPNLGVSYGKARDIATYLYTIK
jgi:cytochrome c1